MSALLSGKSRQSSGSHSRRKSRDRGLVVPYHSSPVLATATNRLYSPKILALLESGDAEGLLEAARLRLSQIIPLMCVFLILIFVFGRSILTVFGAEFVSAYPALCVIATGASISTLFSLAPRKITDMTVLNEERL